MKLPRRQFLHLTGGAVALPALSRVARAQAYPSRPVHIIVGFPPGIAADIVARLTGQRLAERLGQQFVVDNRPGAGSNIATEFVVRAPADGYTLLEATTTNAINATLYPDLNFNFIRDLAPVAFIGKSRFVLVLTPSFPAKTLAEFIAYAKANPGKINMASIGNGTADHVFGELFKMMAGIDLVHVPYRSSYFPDLLGGQVQVAFSPLAQSIGYIRGGKLRALAVAGATRLEALPDVPTVGESVPGYEASGWLGVNAPKSTFAEIVEKLNQEINAVILGADVKARFADIGVEPIPMTPAEYGKFVADETEKWGKVTTAANIKSE